MGKMGGNRRWTGWAKDVREARFARDDGRMDGGKVCTGALINIL